MSLDAGTRLGIHEIIAPIGAGGMGEVYRARDTKLGREVAIKILPEDLMGVQSEPETQEFRVVLNWFDELKRLVPVD